MRGIFLGILGGALILGVAGCGHSPSPATAQYSYTYDVDVPLQAVEPVIYTAAPVPVVAASTSGFTNSAVSGTTVVPGAVPDVVRPSEVEVSPGTAAPTVVPQSGIAPSGFNQAPAGAPSPVTRSGDGLPTPAVNIPVETDAPKSPQNVTTIVEPSPTGNTLDRSTVVVDAPVKATTNTTIRTETKTTQP